MLTGQTDQTGPTVPLEATRAAVGLDVGGSALKAGAVVLDAEGFLHPAERFPQDPGQSRELGPRRVNHADSADAEALESRCARTALALARDVRGALPPAAGGPLPWGVAAAAWIRPQDGHGVFSPHLPGWRDRPLRNALQAAATAQPRGELTLARAPVVLNDADAAAWAEARLGAGHRADADDDGAADGRMVMVVVGTGIGGALVQDGTVDPGAHGMAGEYGHVSLDPRGPQCPCGNIGCWETLVSSAALASRAGRTSARSTLDDALAGDRRCRQAVQQTGRWLGRGLSMLTAVLDPDRFVVGGGLVAGGDLLLNAAREELSDTLPGGSHRSAPTVVAAVLGNQAGWLGAAGRALEDAGHRVTGLVR